MGMFCQPRRAHLGDGHPRSAPPLYGWYARIQDEANVGIRRAWHPARQLPGEMEADQSHPALATRFSYLYYADEIAMGTTSGSRTETPCERPLQWTRIAMLVSPTPTRQSTCPESSRWCTLRRGQRGAAKTPSSSCIGPAQCSPPRRTRCSASGVHRLRHRQMTTCSRT